jgi:hypothetical protein
MVFEKIMRPGAAERCGASYLPESTDKEVKNAVSVNKYRLSRDFRFPPFG